jgi:hypothetical protein
MSKILAGTFLVALVAAGSARAMDPWSFTDQAQEYQGIAQARAARGVERYVGSEPAAPTETGSFTDRVAARQGIALAARPEAPTTSAPSTDLEAASFISRVEAFQGIEEAAPEGAAAGEPREK